MVQERSAAISWDDLAAILAVAKARSIRRAAATLGVAHTTLARRIEAAERSLGIVAFVRSARGYAPTEAGRTIVAHAERMAEEAEALGRAVVGGDRAPRGNVRVTMPPIILTHCVAPALQDFPKRYPGIRLELDTGVGFRDLDRQEADVAIRCQNAPLDDLVGVRIGALSESAYATPDVIAGLAGGGERATCLIAWSDSEGFLDRAAKLGLTDLPVGMLCADVLGQAALAASGVGIAIIPCLVGDAEPSLRRVTPGRTIVAQTVWVLTHPDLRGSARVGAVSSFLVEVLRAALPRLTGAASVDRVNRTDGPTGNARSAIPSRSRQRRMT
jgi:DNA-binding transcriptional LysR family regulator